MIFNDNSVRGGTEVSVSRDEVVLQGKLWRRYHSDAATVLIVRDHT